MANQTVTTVVNYDDAAISGLIDGETLTINGGSVTVDADVRWNQQAAVFGAVTLNSTLGGSFLIDGTKVWEVPFTGGTGTVPTQSALGANGVTGGTSGATGELTRIWASGAINPVAAGAAIPASGFIKLRSKTGSFQAGETITLPGGATITAINAGKRSWVHAVGREAQTITIPRLGTFSVTGDWYELGSTNGADNQTFQFPVADECPALQVETAPGSGVYEWWINGASKWMNIVNLTSIPSATGGNTAVTADAIPSPANASDPYGYFTTGTRVRETAINGIHYVTFGGVAANLADAGNYKFRTYIKKETRRYGFVQAEDGTNRYGVIIDFDTSGAVVLTPTTGTPTGTSQSVTSVGGGWYLVELTLDHALANAIALYAGTSDSASPTLSNGRPSFLGVTTEGVYVAEGQIVQNFANQLVASDDARGKYFFSNPDNGVITFAARSGRVAGMKPASGCKVRIPNVILSNASAIEYNKNSLNLTAATRYDLTTTSGGAVSISNAVCNWYPAATNAFTYTLLNSAAFAVTTSNIAGATTINNCGFGLSRDFSITPISLTNSLSGGTLTDVRATRHVSGNTIQTIGLNTCAGFTMTSVQGEQFGCNGRSIRGGSTNSYALYNINCSNVIWQDCTAIGALAMAQTSIGTKFIGTKYADKLIGTTDGINGGYGISISTSANDTYIEGFSNFSGLPDVHPFAALVSVTTNCDGIEVRNIGTPTSPYNMGSVPATACATIVTLLGTSLNVILRRLYADNVRTAPITTVNTMQNVQAYNVWGDAADVQRIATVSQTSRGCRWTNNGTVESAVYGTHWEDAFTSLKTGRLTIYGNEPLASTADQCAYSFGANAGFTSSGNAAVPNVGDTIIWTMPYYALGHTRIANFISGPSATETWVFTGTNPQNFEFEYQIDKNDQSGFSAWKPLVEIARRSGLGTVGTNQLQITLADWNTMTNQPQVGNYLQGVAANVPAGTTITNISVGSSVTLTLSNNILVSWAANGLTYFWKDIADEAISSTVGYKLKVKCRVNTASSTNSFNYLRIPFDTDAISQQVQYPLPTNRKGVVANIRLGSRLQIYNNTTSSEIVNTVVSGSTYLHEYNNGTGISDGDEIRIRLARCLGPTASIGYEALALANSDGFSLFAAQSDDLVYNANGIDGSTITEFTFDYPNVQVDINDPDGSTTITRLYAWWAKERTTENGIRTLIGGLLAEDSANYKIITSHIDLKLDNTSSTGVIFTGDLRLYRDDGMAPVVSSTTGGGSITLYAGKVYTVSVGGSALTPAESAKLMSIPDSAANATAVREELTATTIPVDAKKMNGATITGDGSVIDPWRGVGVPV